MWNSPVAAFVVMLLLSGPWAADASVSIGFKSAWRGIERALNKERSARREMGPHITVHYPSGAVKDYLWSAVKPFLWSYVCRYCSVLPHRCNGDLVYCKLNLRKVRSLFILPNTIHVAYSSIQDAKNVASATQTEKSELRELKELHSSALLQSYVSCEHSACKCAQVLNPSCEVEQEVCWKFPRCNLQLQVN